MRADQFYSFKISASASGMLATYLGIILYDYFVVFIHNNPKFNF